ncbi:MAG: serine/threonine protein kinase with repeat, partial [Bacteroidetes bacterium]|nr:serine/threonine protein kinase with repeat [Bacteroidota bacterium]
MTGPERDKTMIGQTISHYKILEKLGEGGMGVVYKAQDTTLDRLVALKFLPSHVSASSEDKARFIQEAKAAAALNHPNICTVHGIEEHDNQQFIVMEFVNGQTLQERMSSLSMKQALDIGIQIAEGLAAAHEKGIVHRDIKPENIMIHKDRRVQIMDFGLAKL